MAIVILSSKTYNRRNQKVIDNVIERIEVGSFQKKDNIEHNVLVNTSEIEWVTVEEPVEKNKGNSDTLTPEDAPYYFGGIFVKEKLKYATVNVRFPKYYYDYYISKVYFGESKEGIPNIEAYALYDVTKKQANGTVSLTGMDNYELSNYQEGETIETNINVKGQFDTKANGEYVLPNGLLLNVDFSIPEDKTIVTNQVIDEGQEYFFTCRLIVGKEIIRLGGYNADSENRSRSFLGEGEVEIQLAKKLFLSFYGDKINIDFTDNTVYINGQAQKKVHSVEGNELMQTENYTISSFDKNLQFLIDIVENDNGYRTFSLVAKLKEPKPYEITVTTDARVYLSSGVYNDYSKTFVFAKGETEKRKFVISEDQFVNVDSLQPINTKIKELALEKMYSETQTQYANGKETATIRCSIGDYYDYDSGDKIISIDNSTGKMSFNIGDIVIPMVYGVDGKERPMSLYKNGNAKNFQVLGKKMFYDGAVWQELSLQEV